MTTQLTHHDDAAYYDTFSTYVVVGSRNVDLPTKAVTEALRRTWYAFDLDPVDEIATGDARGVDALVARWHSKWTTSPVDEKTGLPTAAVGFTIGLSVFNAHWETEGRAAGFRRNERIINHTRPEVVIAITQDENITPGTKHMMRTAYQAGVPVVWYTVGHGRLKASGAWNVTWRPSDEDIADDMLALQPQYTEEV